VISLGTRLLILTTLVEGVAPQLPAVVFEEVARRAGVDFVLRNSVTPNRHQIETMVGGVAVFDYNGDGRPDIYFANGASIPELEKTGPQFYNRLYRNDGGWRFTDVTEAAGVRGAGYQMGIAAADYDNDGDQDLFVAGVNRNILYRNRGDGTFEDVTREAGLEGVDARRGKMWSVAAGWFDYDNDGRLDLFVVNYVAWDPRTEPFCGDMSVPYRAYCHPKYYEPLPNSLYRNQGDGTFRDVSESSGIRKHLGKGMALAFGDYDGDGFVDTFVTNDTVPNFLFRNQGNGTFQQMALRAGVAFNDDGRALSSMGADFRDYDNDGRDDVIVTALANETFPLFRNRDGRLFEDRTYSSGLGPATLAWSGWGLGVYDFDNDGHKDLFVAAGDVNDNTELFSSRKSRQSCRVYVNRGNGTFGDVSAAAGPSFQRAALHRGAAFGDFDGDGRVDAVVAAINERAALFRNVTPTLGGWLTVRLEGRKSNRDGIGARLRIVTESGREQWNHATTSVGYASSSDRVVHFGLGSEKTVRLLEIRWPSGYVQRLTDVKAGQMLRVEELLRP